MLHVLAATLPVADGFLLLIRYPHPSQIPKVTEQEEGAKLPWGRMGTAAEIDKAAAFLASDDAEYITGTVLRVDGGFVHRDAVAPV